VYGEKIFYLLEKKINNVPTSIIHRCNRNRSVAFEPTGFRLKTFNPPCTDDSSVAICGWVTWIWSNRLPNQNLQCWKIINKLNQKTKKKPTKKNQNQNKPHSIQKTKQNILLCQWGFDATIGVTSSSYIHQVFPQYDRPIRIKGGHCFPWNAKDSIATFQWYDQTVRLQDVHDAGIEPQLRFWWCVEWGYLSFICFFFSFIFFFSYSKRIKK